MINVPVGNPWEMVAVDVLEVPMTARGNRYLLVIQDYFTKWLEAIPMTNQTAECVTAKLVDTFSRFGLPDILPSDQGSNFESTLLSSMCKAFGIKKSRTIRGHHTCAVRGQLGCGVRGQHGCACLV